MVKKDPSVIPTSGITQGSPVNLNVNLDDEESLTQEEAFAKIAMLLGNTRSPKILTELDDREIKLAAALYAVSEKTGDTTIISFLTNFLLLRVSNKREGRKELLEVAKSSRSESEGRLGRLRNFFGGMR